MRRLKLQVVAARQEHVRYRTLEESYRIVALDMKDRGFNQSDVLVCLDAVLEDVDKARAKLDEANAAVGIGTRVYGVRVTDTRARTRGAV